MGLASGPAQRCGVNQLPPSDDLRPDPPLPPEEPDPDFALVGYLCLLALQNQALRKLAHGLDPPTALPPAPDAPAPDPT